MSNDLRGPDQIEMSLEALKGAVEDGLPGAARSLMDVVLIYLRNNILSLDEARGYFEWLDGETNRE